MNNHDQLRPICDLTERNIKSATPGMVLRDGDIRGLHLRATATKKTFYLYYRTKAGLERRPKLGEYGAITLTQARRIAQELLAQVALGKDPSQERKDARGEPTMSDLWDEYWKRHGSHKKSGAADEWQFNKYVKPKLGNRKLSQIAYEDICDVMDSMKGSPIQANRVLALLSKMFSFAYRPLQWVNDNPCKGVKRNQEIKRRRYMTAEEATKIAQLLDEAAEHHPAGVAFIYLLILTGARCGEIANAKWEYLDGSVLRLPDSKTGARSIYLPKAALDILARLPKTSGTILGIQSPKKLWERIRTEIGSPDLRLHDLRHSFASAALGAGFSLAQIGELLGHRNTQTTQRYAHLVEEAAAQAAEATASVLMGRMKATV